MREYYIRLARRKFIAPGKGENCTPVPESHKLTIKVVDKKSRRNLFIDSATDNVESVSHSLPYFCLSARKKLDLSENHQIMRVKLIQRKAALTF